MFYAHSHERGPAHWQSLFDHLTGVAALAAAAAARVGDQHAACAYLTGLLHDLGKYDPRFQKRLEGNPLSVDHSTAGAWLSTEQWGNIGTLMAYALAGHHAGLADGRGGARGRRDALPASLTPLFDSNGGRLTGGRGAEKLAAADEAWRREVEPLLLDRPSQPGFDSDHEGFSRAFFVRHLLSCLVDGDRTDTATHEAREWGRPITEPEAPSLEALRDRLTAHMATLDQVSDIHRWRSEILAAAREKAAMPPGAFTMTVPTGGGKTLASMAFALDHAIRHGLDRVIYVIPYTSIIEQNAAVFREAFGDLGEAAVLEHHSAVHDAPLEAATRADGEDVADAGGPPPKLRRATETWDSPVVVTTAVQFFETLFANRPTKLCKLHRVARSAIVLDEAQTLPTDLLKPCVTALRTLTENYGSTAVLCTATQPALGEEDGFAGGFPPLTEIAPDPKGLYERFRRVEVRQAGRILDEALAEKLRVRERALCIVNQKAHAAALFDSLKDEPGTFFLTTALYPAHRTRRLKEVREALEAGGPCRLIATSLVEAGVDLDFPTVFRAACGLESLAQAAGRCNREGKRDLGEVVWFESSEDHGKPLPDMRDRWEAAQLVARRHADDPLGLDAIKAYFGEVYWGRDGDLGEDVMRLHDARADAIPFETIARDVRLIRDGQVPVIVPREAEARALIDRLGAGSEPLGSLARQLGRYSVSLYERAFDRLVKERLISFVAEERYGRQFAQLNLDGPEMRPPLYTKERGIDTSALDIRPDSLTY